jgi:hypothetical protein
MAIKRAAVHAFYHLVGWLIGLARLLIGGALLVTLVPFAFVLTAQLYRWVSTGDWRAVSIDDFFRMLALRSDAPGDSSGSIDATLRVLPATLTLALTAIVFFIVDLCLKRADRARLDKFARSRQQEVASEIDRALAVSPE